MASPRPIQSMNFTVGPAVGRDGLRGRRCWRGSNRGGGPGCCRWRQQRRPVRWEQRQPCLAAGGPEAGAAGTLVGGLAAGLFAICWLGAGPQAATKAATATNEPVCSRRRRVTRERSFTVEDPFVMSPSALTVICTSGACGQQRAPCYAGSAGWSLAGGIVDHTRHTDQGHRHLSPPLDDDGKVVGFSPEPKAQVARQLSIPNVAAPVRQLF